uniref:Uncharacterized protein n=1 Tax=Tanacetum cinerariifolium TaxID=118510 RepID=A0A699GEI0_TANCI|nr:hypothetical protein [Tanacetum cinerariifolium]
MASMPSITPPSSTYCLRRARVVELVERDYVHARAVKFAFIEHHRRLRDIGDHVALADHVAAAVPCFEQHRGLLPEVELAAYLGHLDVLGQVVAGHHADQPLDRLVVGAGLEVVAGQGATLSRLLDDDRVGWRIDDLQHQGVGIAGVGGQEAVNRFAGAVRHREEYLPGFFVGTVLPSPPSMIWTALAGAQDNASAVTSAFTTATDARTVRLFFFSEGIIVVCLVVVARYRDAAVAHVRIDFPDREHRTRSIALDAHLLQVAALLVRVAVARQHVGQVLSARGLDGFGRDVQGQAVDELAEVFVVRLRGVFAADPERARDFGRHERGLGFAGLREHRACQDDDGDDAARQHPAQRARGKRKHDFAGQVPVHDVDHIHAVLAGFLLAVPARAPDADHHPQQQKAGQNAKDHADHENDGLVEVPPQHLGRLVVLGGDGEIHGVTSNDRGQDGFDQGRTEADDQCQHQAEDGRHRVLAGGGKAGADQEGRDGKDLAEVTLGPADDQVVGFLEFGTGHARVGAAHQYRDCRQCQRHAQMTFAHQGRAVLDDCVHFAFPFMWTSAGGVKRTVPRRCMACSARATGRGAATSWRSMIWASGAWCATMLRIALARAAMTACCPAGGPTKSERAVISTRDSGRACAALINASRSASFTREELKKKPISTVRFTSFLSPMPAAAGLTGIAVGAGRTAVFTLGMGQDGTAQYTYRVLWPVPTWVMSNRGAGSADAGGHADVPHAHSEAARHAISALRAYGLPGVAEAAQVLGEDPCAHVDIGAGFMQVLLGDAELAMQHRQPAAVDAHAADVVGAVAVDGMTCDTCAR